MAENHNSKYGLNDAAKLQIKQKWRWEEGKNSSQAICLCQNLQKKLTESFFSFFLCSAGDGKKVEEKFG